MTRLIDFIENRLPVLKILFASATLSLLLLMVRMVVTGTNFYAFLVWNLFLAAIPFAMTTYLASQPWLSCMRLALWFCPWLLFLPNAPYIVTDLMHLQWDNHGHLWLDMLLVTSFAWNGLILCFLSLLDMHDLLRRKSSERFALWSIVIVLFLCGFGIYLGRFLRWNSWDIVQHPGRLFEDIAVRIVYPLKHLRTWGVTMGFGGFLSMGFWILKELRVRTKPEIENWH